jgi:hypothetical protein
VRATLDGLALPQPSNQGKAGEQVLLVVPREDPDSYARFRLLADLGKAKGAALFLGDPLAETTAAEGAAQPVGLAANLAKSATSWDWQVCQKPGPHRGRFIHQLVACAEAAARKQTDRGLELAVVSLGGSDAAEQTPLYDFERGLDVVVDRLRRAGTRRILLVGVMPRPRREAQAERYRARCAEVVGQHYLESLDLYALWTKEPDWERRFKPAGQEDRAVYGPTPSAAALEQLAGRIKALMERQ